MSKEELHRALQGFTEETQPHLGAVYVTRYIAIVELALPTGTLALHRVSGQADGQSLVTWEADGLLFNALFSNRRELPRLDRSEDPDV